MALKPTLLVVPSVSAGQILLRRLAREKGAIAAIEAMRPVDLAARMSEARCHALGLQAWRSGHGALLAARLLAAHRELLPEGLPEAPVARVLARTLDDLRAAGILPPALKRLADKSQSLEDRTRLSAVAAIYARYKTELEERFFDDTRLFAEAETADAPFLLGSDVLLSPDLAPRPDEFRFLASLGTRFGARRLTEAGVRTPGSFASSWDAAALPTTPWADTVFAPVVERRHPGLVAMTDALFEAPAPAAGRKRGSPAPAPDAKAVEAPVSWLTAPGEASECEAVARRILAAARDGLSFDDMAVVIPQPDVYASMLADVLTRARIPFKLHPSLPLATGRVARSLLLLLGAREFDRGALLEFLTFAPLPLAAKSGDPEPPHPSVFDQLTRDLKVVSGVDRFLKAIDHLLALPHVRPERLKTARALRTLVTSLRESLAFTEERLPLDQWATRLVSLCQDWIAPTTPAEEAERQLVLETLEELGALASVSAAVSFDRVLSVIEAQLDRKRRPLEERSRVGVHIGSPDALAGARFRLVAVLGLVEGRFPGVFRPDPFLLDAERRTLADEAVSSRPAKPVAQLNLFDEPPPPPAPPGSTLLPTTESRAAETRRLFARILRQAEDALVLSYPRADEQSGRERLPSLFLMAALQAFKGVPVTAADLGRVVTEDEEADRDLDLVLDPGERDTTLVERYGLPALRWLEESRPFLRAAHELSRGRQALRLSPYDGLVGREGEDTNPLLDPIKGGHAVSASRLATYGECGFRYFLRYVLRLEPALEPEERRKLDPLEKGTLFHEVAELFLRERRDAKALPVRNTEEERRRLFALAEERLEAWVEGSPPRLLLLWRAEKRVFLQLLSDWLKREADSYRDRKALPAHFEVSFGMPYRKAQTNEPHRDEPVDVALDDGRVLRISGQIDRVDRIDPEEGGGLILRDYKTGKAPDNDNSLFKGGRQLQIPFYILAAREIFPGERVVSAFLDYVNAGRPVIFDPEKATSATFRALLLRISEFIGRGVFIQEPSACTFCDFQTVCGPAPVLEARKRRRRQFDPLVRKVGELKDFA